jgi:hypothetical protein
LRPIDSKAPASAEVVSSGSGSGTSSSGCHRLLARKWSDADVEVAVDPVEMDQVQRFERATIALLGAIDERAHALGLALLLRDRSFAHRD